jgi:hypothetical protein
MLVYHPAFDLHHCTFRMLQILFNINQENIESDKLRIWDFYYTFPNEIGKNITFIEELRALKKIFKNNLNPYEEIGDVKKVFEQMKPYQLTALNHLASHNLIDNALWENKLINLNKDMIPADLLTRLSNLTTQQQNILKLIGSPFNDLPLYGKLGFKSRTGLIDFKYDRL